MINAEDGRTGQSDGPEESAIALAACAPGFGAELRAHAKYSGVGTGQDACTPVQEAMLHLAHALAAIFACSLGTRTYRRVRMPRSATTAPTGCALAATYPRVGLLN